MFVEVELHAVVRDDVRQEGCGFSPTLGIQRGVGGRFGIDLVPVVIVVGERVVDGSQRELRECLQQFFRCDTLTKDVLNYAMYGEAGASDVWTSATDRGVGRDMGV